MRALTGARTTDGLIWRSYRKRIRLARHFNKGREKFQALTQLVTIQVAVRCRLEVRCNPAYGVQVAVCPCESTDSPYAGASAAMRATLEGASPIEWKLQNVVAAR